MEETHQGLARCSLQSGSVSGRLGEGRGRGAAAAPVQPGAPTPRSYLRGEVRYGSVHASFQVLEEPGHTGMTHPEMQVLRSACRVSQRQRNESYSPSPPGLPCTDISCGFLLRLSLTHSTGRKARFMFWRKRKRREQREGGWEGGGRMKLNPAALLLYLSLPESKARKNKASVLLGVFICLFRKEKKKAFPFA